MIKEIGSVCVVAALTLDALSYWRQVKKVIKTKKSAQVSSTSYLYKIAKALFAMGGLAIYANWVGFGMEALMMLIYIVSLIIIAHFKPRGWSLWR